MLCHVYRHGCDIPELQYYMVVSFIPNLLLVCRLAHSFRWGAHIREKRRPMSDSETNCSPLRYLCGVNLQYIFLHAFANLGDSTPPTLVISYARIHITMKKLCPVYPNHPQSTYQNISNMLYVLANTGTVGSGPGSKQVF